MASITITGTIHGVSNTTLANKWIVFRLDAIGTDSVTTVTVVPESKSIQTDASGNFSFVAWNNGDSGTASLLGITIEGSPERFVVIPTGTPSIELWDLLENYPASGADPQLPISSSLFVRKSNNLSDLGNAGIARTNIGVAIGTNVQAHSATLDATTASFTTAKDTAISTNTANIASNDTDIATNVTAIALNTAKVTNATHTGDVTGDTALTIANDAVDIPMLSASGTPDATSFLRGDNTWSVPAAGGPGDLLAANNLSELTATASTARANIGVSIGSDIQAHSAILDGTTASFTVADEAKLTGYSPTNIITESTSARTLALTDVGAYIRLTNASSCTITIPANATVDWAGETEPPTVYVRVAAAGIPTLSSAGVTINDTLGVIAALEEGSTFALQWVANNVWDII